MVLVQLVALPLLVTILIARVTYECQHYFSDRCLCYYNLRSAWIVCMLLNIVWLFVKVNENTTARWLMPLWKRQTFI